MIRRCIRPTAIRRAACYAAATLKLCAGVAAAQAPAPRVSQVMEIGGDDAASSYTFARISGIDVGRRGEIYVLDAGDRMVKVYDPSGQFVRRIGREGSGPGEFRHPVEV